MISCVRLLMAAEDLRQPIATQKMLTLILHSGYDWKIFDICRKGLKTVAELTFVEPGTYDSK